LIKVILNVLPPARIDTPSAAMSVLQAFMVHHNIETRIIYWNILLDQLMPSFGNNSDMIHFNLLPYLYLIAGEHNDDIAQSKANAFIKSQMPLYDILNDNSDYLVNTKILFEDIAARELSCYSQNNQLLFGISCKYEQWIAGMVLGRYMKHHFPDSKIVIGGLRNRDKAESIMKICNDVDFSIWGEGEYPLLKLCQTINDQTADLNSVPRLMFRKDGSLQTSGTDVSRFYDMNSRIFPDHDDYFNTIQASNKKDVAVILPLESSRGCTWNACRFCVYGQGYENRKKDPGVLKEEIIYLFDKYNIPNFAFMDNDIVANDHDRLERILDDLISIKQSKNIHFIAEVIPKDFTIKIMQKLPRAGFNRIHFGYESLSDSLLKKMKKRTNFSDNLFFVKFARKYRIRLPSANIICGTIGENDVDILESIDNLHFLRFYFDRDFFCHNLIPLTMAKHSDFYDMVTKEELTKWNENVTFYLLPGKMTQGIDRFSLFDFSAHPDFLWELFSKINEFYYDHLYSYSIFREDGLTIYKEFFDGEPVIKLTISDLEYRILQQTNSTIIDLGYLLENLGQENNSKTDERSVRIALDRLKEKHLIYFNGAHRSIISVIDTD
jgi:radical SAM superfamily enzyme YgiQ (UPF0313 family)